jgi:hypothetical protein
MEYVSLFNFQYFSVASIRANVRHFLYGNARLYDPQNAAVDQATMKIEKLFKIENIDRKVKSN